MYASHPHRAAILLFATALPVAAGRAQRDCVWINDAAFPPTTSAQAGQIALEPSSEQLVMLRSNGQTLSWDGTALQLLSSIGTPLIGASIAASQVPGFDGVVAFGGRSASGLTLAQTLLYSNGTWARRFPANLPPARAYASMTTMGQQPVLFGGVDANGQDLDDTWMLTSFGGGARWLEVFDPTPPAARHGAAMCPDGSGGLLLFGGRSAGQLRGDTWRFGTDFAWNQVASPVAPPPGVGPMSFDPDRREVIHVDPVGGTTYRFDPTTSEWQPLTGVTLPTPFAATTTGAPCYMAYDPHRREHVFVDANAGLSIFSVADASVRHRQPAECSPHLAIDLAFGSPRLGGAYVLHVEGAVPGAPVWLGASARRLHLPGILPVSNCLAFLTDWVMLLPEFASPSGAAWFAIGVPPDRDLVGFEVDHQAIDLWTLGVTDDLVARVARA